jgi:hypothetical protein
MIDKEKITRYTPAIGGHDCRHEARKGNKTMTETVEEFTKNMPEFDLPEDLVEMLKKSLESNGKQLIKK